jgi:hypothetical protein
VFPLTLTQIDASISNDQYFALKCKSESQINLQFSYAFNPTFISLFKKPNVKSYSVRQQALTTFFQVVHSLPIE